MTKDYSLSSQFFNLHLFLWRHLLTSSVRLFNVVLRSAVRMEYFSAKVCREDGIFLSPCWYGFAWQTMLHAMVGS